MAAISVAGFSLGAGNSVKAESVYYPDAGKPVHYNWGWGSPGNGVPADNFTATFDQSGNYSSGDYFIQTFADDGVKVEADGHMLINRWSDYTGQPERALWLGVNGGPHTVKTHYLEKVANAAVFSDIVPFDSWLAYYYPNESLAGVPATAKVISPSGDFKNLYEDFGGAAPADGIPADHFSAKYVSAKRIPAGEYILRAKADDGIRVYVDGKLQIDRWTSSAFREDSIKINIADRADAKTGEKDIHWIEVEYFDSVAAGKVEFFLEQFSKATENAWVGEVFPSKDLQGTPVIIGGNNGINPISNIDFDWGWGNGSPHPAIPGDGFSARFTKRVNLEAGSYIFNANADDGVRVKLDGQTIINAWPNTKFTEQKKVINVTGGTHTIEVEYLEDVALAKLSFNFHRLSELPVVYAKQIRNNWGWGSPGNGISGDYFTAVFDQSGSYPAGDYFLQTFADDGVKVEVDGQWPINRWGDYTGKVDRALLLGMNGGQHTIKTHYLENVANAAIFSEMVPLGSWLAYYYTNPATTGMPATGTVIPSTGDVLSFSQDFGGGSPAPGMASDNFSAKYTTAKRIPAGDYILRANADDGVRVYVDGKLQIDRWTSSAFREDSIKINIADRADAKTGEKDIHWIEVEYFDSVDAGKVEFSLEKFSKATENAWVGEVFPNKDLQGTPIVIGGNNALNPISSIDYDWGTGSPHPSIAGDGFSARFTKRVNLEAGSYIFNANADDGVRVKLDGQTIINAWPNIKFAKQKKILNVTGGNHIIEVEYFEDVASAKLSFNVLPFSQLPVVYAKQVRNNWGLGSPGDGIPGDYFTAVFDQSGIYPAGDYFLQTFADDGVKVEVDGQWPVNRWGDYTGQVDRALLLGMTGGQHTIKTHYLENVANAAIFSEMVPLGSWLAYYYTNPTLSGMPATGTVIPSAGDVLSLSQDFGAGSPAPGMAADNFSAKYTTAKRIPAGEYIFRAKADDGIRVYVDGQLAVNQWTEGAYREGAVKINISDRADAKTGEKDIHWIEVEYFDSVAAGKVEFSLEQFSKATENAWVGEVFPNKNLQGTPFIIGGNNALHPISNIDFDWGWENSSPYPSVGTDNFSMRFTKKVNLDTGTYLFVLNADDGVRVLLDNQLIINHWPNAGLNEKRQDVYINGGNHTITVEYYEDVGNAHLLIDIKKLSPNRVFYQQNHNVQYNWGSGGPSSYPVDGFEAVFDQSGVYAAGDYFLQTFADDGIKVDVDGKELINRWTDYTGKADRALWIGANAGKHSVLTHYYDNVSTAAVFSHVLPFDTWLAYYFPNETLSGMPAVAKMHAPAGPLKSLYEDLQDVSPAPGVDKDHFSVRYTTAKRITAGSYLFRTKADDGVRVYVDGKLVLDRWTSSALREDTATVQISNRADAASGEQDIHWIDVEYFDDVNIGKVEFSIEPLIGPVYQTTNYHFSLTQMVDTQMTTLPQTDLHTKYLREDALTRDAKGNWVVNGSGWNVRGGPGTNYPVVGTINNGTPVRILKTINVDGQPTWYQVSAWMNALRGDVEYYVNPGNFSKGSTEYFQFLKLSESAGLNVNEVNDRILNGKGILQGKASSFIEAGTRLGINEVYLISHALLETGNGTSNLATGVVVSQLDGQAVEPKTVYNMYGINAKDSCPLQCGSEYAYKMGWTSPERAIVGGAEFIAGGYIHNGQDNLYKMRWNPGRPGTHQYASDIGWATKQVNRIKNLYDLLSNYTLVFDEPKFQ
ncbi:PA14 domain-containing protein [Bacillus sp. T33-2]|uniref:PA14 domain-containing protein n=1 Tax=Bacillus sp. T33-2 TaxID=2054168 RepID=UPI000C789837|nr:PA14 domain-containing protein [Bacillus sp. T33-2]PLR90780.1 hypothetical protein CVD19_22375 [Bacillus sp. T33-2]